MKGNDIFDLEDWNRNLDNQSQSRLQNTRGIFTYIIYLYYLLAINVKIYKIIVYFRI